MNKFKDYSQEDIDQARDQIIADYGDYICEDEDLEILMLNALKANSQSNFE